MTQPFNREPVDVARRLAQEAAQRGRPPPTSPFQPDDRLAKLEERIAKLETRVPELEIKYSHR